jgi:hypothetical protein
MLSRYSQICSCCHSGLYIPLFVVGREGAKDEARICDNVHGDHAVIGAFFVTGTTSAGQPSRLADVRKRTR